MPDPVRLVIIAEDSVHERFVREVLREMGSRIRPMRFFPSPSGRGAADRWVRDRFVHEVTALRGRAGRKQGNVGLLAVIDADTRTATQRQSWLDDALQEQNREKRRDHERIAIWTPRRNIETWLTQLAGRQTADEESDYKSRPDWSASEIQTAARAFVGMFHAQPPNNETALDSIKRALAELRRLIPAR